MIGNESNDTNRLDSMDTFMCYSQYEVLHNKHGTFTKNGK